MEKPLRYSQEEIIIKTTGQKMYEITDNINSWLLNENINFGQLNVFIKHTSASICIQENASRDVLDDIQKFFYNLVPEDPSLYKHNFEGPDDMPAHLKTSILGTSIQIPITNGLLNLGTWQGIYLCEHRNNGGRRKLVITAWGN